MAREWKPGDVAMMTAPDGREFMAVRTKGGEDHWSAPRGWPSGVSDYMCEARPLVVIDPEDREQIERLAALLFEPIDHLAAALREFASPPPPKPEEPTGLGAVVEDANGKRWVRVWESAITGRVWTQGLGGGERPYADINAVRVLSEGVAV